VKEEESGEKEIVPARYPSICGLGGFVMSTWYDYYVFLLEKNIDFTVDNGDDPF
jgi:hypothetical protein